MDYIWNLENYKIEGKNKYSEIIDKSVKFDFKNREIAMKDLFNSTSDQNVKQVLIYAMELNNHYRKEAIQLYLTYHQLKKDLNKAIEVANDVVEETYL